MSASTHPYKLSVAEALRLIEKRELSSREWITSCLERIDHREPDVRAFVEINSRVLDEVDKRLGLGLGPSIPIGVKDIIDVRGLPTMMGTDFHDNRPAKRDAGSVAIMRDAGCVIVGKTVTTELGHRHPGPTRNPHAFDHTPGGSSSGSAAAVADLMIPLSLGTQTTGSVIRPAAYCGIVGYKPTYNDFDKSGILPNAPSMDTLGIMARTVQDTHFLRQTLLEEPSRVLKSKPLRDLCFGFLKGPLWLVAELETQDLIENFVGALARKGGRITEIALEDETKQLLELQRVISSYEFRRSIADERINHEAQLSRVLREGRLADGNQVTNREYQMAIQELINIKLALAKNFYDIDILLMPSAKGAALTTLKETGDPIFNSAWTVSGNPAITLPLFNARSSQLPIGCQFVAGFANDMLLLEAAATIMHEFAPTSER